MHDILFDAWKISGDPHTHTLPENGIVTNVRPSDLELCKELAVAGLLDVFRRDIGEHGRPLAACPKEEAAIPITGIETCMFSIIGIVEPEAEVRFVVEQANA